MRFLKTTLLAACAFAVEHRRSQRTAAAGENPHVVGRAGVQLGARSCWRRRSSPGTSASPTCSKPVRYRGTPQMITALANNELEVSNLAYSTLPIAIQNAGLDDIRVIADEFQDGVAGYYSTGIYVLQGRPDQEGRGPQGQDRRDQRRRQRGRRRDARRC